MMFASLAQVIGVLIGSLWLSVAIQPDGVGYEVVIRPEPTEVKAIYLTGYTAGSAVRRARLVDLIRQTELNAVVIDIKDSTGRVFFDSSVPLVDEIKAEDIRIPDLAEWLAELKQEGIYTIARLVVFQDPHLAIQKPEIALKSSAGGLWRDWKGLAWVDPTHEEIWDYNLDIAQNAVAIGFDEINFDYIRFPSDGNIRQIVYANLETYGGKNETIEAFFKYLDRRMSRLPAITSADLFGMVLWRSDGLNIGQRYEAAAPHFDFIAPMVYPSHYPDGFEGFANPAEHPYEIIHRSLIRAKDLSETPPRAKLRPWLQAFDLGAPYTGDMIELEKQATYDAGGQGWMLWNAANRYTAAGLAAEN